MTSRRLGLLIAAVGLLAVAGVAAVHLGLVADENERTTVTVHDEGGERLATIEVRVADTPKARYVGLSETGSLDEGEGMLFVHDSEGERAYVMRNMTFPLDILFIDAEERITTIHHASVPSEGTDEGDLKRYEGRGKYVLEVRRGYANETGIEVGHRVRIPNETA